MKINFPQNVNQFCIQSFHFAGNLVNLMYVLG